MPASNASKLLSNFTRLKQAKNLAANQSQLETVRELNVLYSKLVQVASLPSFTTGRTLKKTVPADVLSQLKGVYIWGSVGSGKSLLLDLFYSSLQEEARALGSTRLHFHDLIRWIHNDLYLRRSADQKGDLLAIMGENLATKTPVICIDEFFVRDIGEAMLIKGLFSGVWGAGGVLVATSNRHPEKLYENGLNRNLFTPFIKQLEQRCSVINLSHDEDFRMKKIPSSSQCLFKSNEKAKFDESFLTEINDAYAGPVQIDIPNLSRSITVIAGKRKRKAGIIDQGFASSNAKDLVVRSSFDELCKSNKSANDYRALMERASILYLENVSSIGANELNDARRFITLVDVAYEHKTRIILHTLEGCNSISDILIHVAKQQGEDRLTALETRIVNQGGSSSSAATTFIGDMEWSATGLKEASLAAGGNTDTRFAVGRTISRLVEMAAVEWDTI